MYIKFNLIAMCLFLLAILPGCEQKKADNSTGNIQTVASKLIDDHFKFLNAHDLKSLRKQYTDNAFITSPDNQGAQPGPIGADEIFHYTFLLSSNMQYVISHQMLNDTAAVVQYEVRGTKTRDGNPNVLFIYKGCSIFKIKGDKIESEMIYANPPSNFNYINGRIMR